ncbi:MAG: thiol oxidoreductase [Chitinophagaceae bacterium]|nr:thiol oxidoreductase [Chitinophagaceae bacterium]
MLCMVLIAVYSCKKKDGDEAVTSIYDPAEEYPGGTGTSFDFSSNAFGNSMANLSSNGEDSFVIGNSFFRNNWVIAPSSTTGRDGLGPFFNAESCSGCHKDDGRGRPPLTLNEISGLLMRLSIPGTSMHGGPLGDPSYGEQLSDHAIPGVNPEGSISLTYTAVNGMYTDGTVYNLQNPQYQIINLNYGSLSSSMLFSPRVAQQMPGLGLLETIDESTILSFADETDANADGISGRANYVWDYKAQATALGRFGWKANQPTLRQQTAAAFLGDIGITSSLFPDQNLTTDQYALYGSLANGGNPEVSDYILDNVVFYNATLAVPGRRNAKDDVVLQGKQLFLNLKCNSCHVPSMTTGTHPKIPALSHQKIFPYTDLLLHDMGSDLADGRPDYLATASEWRTPPLWGIGLIKQVSNHTNLLHDGRARNVEEAILWHGGEALKSKNDFLKLNASERAALIKFVNSL